ncbi:DNA polymerase III subunit chi [Pseudomonas sp. NPDC087626]|uniref:DNA polymerase III subunit chi n=1 Tax=Pseudomonas sp. NPDC087626 TaxID=3364444 RepID=UPI003809CA81
MDTPKPLQKAAHLLDDLESIRQLLGDDNLQPPLLTDTVETASDEGQIPLLFDQVSGKPLAEAVEQPAPAPAPAPTPAPAPAATTTAQQAADVMLHLDGELRAAAQLIMQDVIDDFAPHIETEIKRRLDARMERLLSQYDN